MNLNASSDASLLPAVSMHRRVRQGVNYAVLQFRQAKTLAGAVTLVVQYGYAASGNAPTTWLSVPSGNIFQLPNADANTAVFQVHVPVPQGSGAFFTGIDGAVVGTPLCHCAVWRQGFLG